MLTVDERTLSTDDEMRPNSSAMPALSLAAVAALASPCALANAPPVNDFPTLARVEYVLRCMDQHGGQIYENMYACVCSVDRIAAEFGYDEFVKAEVLAQLRETPGERGSLFREGGSELVAKYLEVTEAAEKSCFGSSGPK